MDDVPTSDATDEVPEAQPPTTPEAAAATPDAPTEAAAALPAPPPPEAAEPMIPAGSGRGPMVVTVPRWLPAVLVVVVLAGGFFALGRVTADDDHDGFGARRPGVVFDRGPVQDRRAPQITPRGGSRQAPQRAEQNQAVLGVSVADVGSADARQLGVTATSGAAVVRVASGSGADKAGIRAGDVITKIGNTAIGTAADAAPAVRSHDAGSTVDVVIVRSGNSQTVRVTLGSSSTLNAS